MGLATRVISPAPSCYLSPICNTNEAQNLIQFDVIYLHLKVREARATFFPECVPQREASDDFVEVEQQRGEQAWCAGGDTAVPRSHICFL